MTRRKDLLAVLVGGMAILLLIFATGCGFGATENELEDYAALDVSYLDDLPPEGKFQTNTIFVEIEKIWGKSIVFVVMSGESTNTTLADGGLEQISEIEQRDNIEKGLLVIAVEMPEEIPGTVECKPGREFSKCGIAVKPNVHSYEGEYAMNEGKAIFYFRQNGILEGELDVFNYYDSAGSVKGTFRVKLPQEGE